MARRRFFVSQVRRGIAELTGPEAEHLVRVLRAEPGQLYEISDNNDVYLAEIELARKSAVSFRVLQKLELPRPSVQVVLIAALIKFERFEWLVEKATELGVSVIQPFEATRTERGLAEASGKRIVRWQKVAREASQQARRARLPVIEHIISWEKALFVNAQARLMLDEDPHARPMLEAIPQDRKAVDSVALLCGPEGGWRDEERAQARETGWIPSSLGLMILRSETAALAGIAVIQAAWDRR